MTVTSTGLSNQPDKDEELKLWWVYCFLVSPIEKYFEIEVTSGYRSEAVNSKVGGSPTSQHRKAEACDFISKSAPLPIIYQWCRKNLVFGQLIIEEKDGKKWIHISMPRIDKTNLMTLEMKNGSYRNI